MTNAPHILVVDDHQDIRTLLKRHLQQYNYRVTLAANDDSKPPGVSIFIEDNGPGIPTEDKNVVFKRGYRGEYTNTLTKGSGIGLDISRELTALMGGSLDLLEHHKSKEYLEGTVMRFTLYRKPNI